MTEDDKYAEQDYQEQLEDILNNPDKNEEDLEDLTNLQKNGPDYQAYRTKEEPPIYEKGDYLH
jgi:hypothetical protein